LTPNDRLLSQDYIDTGPFIRIFADGQPESEYGYEITHTPEKTADSIILGGELSERIAEMLNQTKPNCHEAALKALDFIDAARWVWLSELQKIYRKREAEFSYTPFEPPALLYLSQNRLNGGSVPDFQDMNAEDIVRLHSVVLLGEIGQISVCLQKKPGCRPEVEALEAIERDYQTKGRLYVRRK